MKKLKKKWKDDKKYRTYWKRLLKCRIKSVLDKTCWIYEISKTSMKVWQSEISGIS